MNRLIYLLLLIPLFQCSDSDPYPADGVIQFSIDGIDHRQHNVSGLQINNSDVNAWHDSNSDSVYVYIEFWANFEDPTLAERTMAVNFYYGFGIPLEEFVINNQGDPIFKNPESILSYIPSGNLVEAEDIDFVTWLHQDVNTFCTGQILDSISNSFEIVESEVIEIEAEKHLRLKGDFDVSYEKWCEVVDDEFFQIIGDYNVLVKFGEF